MQSFKRPEAMVWQIVLCLFAVCGSQTRGDGQMLTETIQIPAVTIEVKIVDPEVFGFITPETTFRCAILAREGRSVLDGDFEVLNANGTAIVRGTYVEGVLSGLLTTYHADGRIASRSNYDHGLLEGVGLIFSSAGDLRRIALYHEGHKVGRETYFADDGTPSIIVERGRQVKSIRLFSSGVLVKTYEGQEALDYILKKATDGDQ